MSILREWLASSKENRRIFAQESFIVSVTEAIWEAMEIRGVNKQQLADALGVGRSNVTQLLNGSRNMTLRTLADIAHGLGYKVDIKLVDESPEAQRLIFGHSATRSSANTQWASLECLNKTQPTINYAEIHARNDGNYVLAG